MIITGKAKIIKKAKDYYKIKDKAIIVAVNTAPEIVVAIDKILAIVTEVDNKLCHAAIIAREYNKPILMGQIGATKKFKDGEKISINLNSKAII